MYLFQIARGDDSWSCVGENVFDVLLEMQREREKKDQVQLVTVFFLYKSISKQ